MVDLIAFGKIISDETRQQIMRLLCCRWLCVTDLVAELGGQVTQPTVSHHLSELKKVGLVARRREGKQIFYTLNQERVAICCGQLMLNFAPDMPLDEPTGQPESLPD